MCLKSRREHADYTLVPPTLEQCELVSHSKFDIYLSAVNYLNRELRDAYDLSAIGGVEHLT